jgi:hypothetical protein
MIPAVDRPLPALLEGKVDAVQIGQLALNVSRIFTSVLIQALTIRDFALFPTTLLCH